MGKNKKNKNKTTNQHKKKKAPLIRIYEKMFPEKHPGQYDRKADLRHLIAMLVFIIVIVGTLVTCFYLWTEHNKYLVSSKLIIPETSFTTTQMDNVKDVLEENGFTDITYVDDVGIMAFGTPEQVSAYKQSYKEKFVTPMENSLSEDYSEYGIEDIIFSNDWKHLQFVTYTDDIESTLFDTIFNHEEIRDIINVCATWCAMQNDGEKLTVDFLDIVMRETYYSTQASSIAELVSQLEALEQQAANANTNTEENTDGNSNNNVSNSDDDGTVSTQNTNMNMESNIDLEDNVKQENIEDSNNENLETEEETQEN